MQPGNEQEKQKQRKILIVDDNQSLLDSIAELLEMNGYVSEPAGDLASARNIYKRERPDLVLLDCDVRGCDGLDLISDFRREPPASPVIVMTARDDRATQLRCRQLGAESMVNKPFRVKELIAEIQRVLLAHSFFTPEPLAKQLKLLAYHLPKLLGPQKPRPLLKQNFEEEN